MVEDTRVLRGEQWGGLLQRRLPDGGSLRQWMKTHMQILKDDQTSQVGLLELGGEPCYLKYYQGRTWLQSALYRYGRGRPTRAFDSAAALWQAGVAVPRPLSCLAVPGGAILLAEGIADSRDLQGLVKDGGLAEIDDCILAAAASLLGRLHSAGYAHGDCKWSNLLYAAGRLCLVDLDGVSHCGRGSRQQARDIARFTVNAEELALPAARYQRFLESYLEASEWTRQELLSAMRPFLDKFRRRHRLRYGERGHHLI